MKNFLFLLLAIGFLALPSLYASDESDIQAIDKQKEADVEALFQQLVKERHLTASMVTPWGDPIRDARGEAEGKVFHETDKETRERLLAYYSTKGKLSDFEEAFSIMSLYVYIDNADGKEVLFILTNLYTNPNPIDNQTLVESKLSEPVRLVFKAEENAAKPEVKQALMSILRDAFETISLTTSSDAEFLVKASEWYHFNEKKLVLNSDYYYRFFGNANVPPNVVEKPRDPNLFQQNCSR